jgi:opacity protein-like surface antigen
MKRHTLFFALALGVLAAPAAFAANSTTPATTRSTSGTTTAHKAAPAPSHAAPAAARVQPADPEPVHRSDLGLKRIGGALGYVSPENLDGVLGLGAFADWGTIAPRIGLESRLDYWSHSEESFGAKASIHDVIFGARAKYMFEVANPRIQPFAGGGLALHFLGAKVETPAMGGLPAMSASSSDTKLGVDLGGGISSPINPSLDFLGEAWYGIVSDVSQLSLRVGLSYRMGSR